MLFGGFNAGGVVDLAGDNSEERLEARYEAFMNSSDKRVSSIVSCKLDGPAEVCEDGPDAPEGVLLILGVVEGASELTSISTPVFNTSVLAKASPAALLVKILSAPSSASGSDFRLIALEAVPPIASLGIPPLGISFASEPELMSIFCDKSSLSLLSSSEPVSIASDNSSCKTWRGPDKIALPLLD